MSASLVGSEMCIRDRSCALVCHRGLLCVLCTGRACCVHMCSTGRACCSWSCSDPVWPYLRFCAALCDDAQLHVL
eukprot:8422599-Alexandrium_andersonii.AAC.1